MHSLWVLAAQALSPNELYILPEHLKDQVLKIWEAEHRKKLKLFLDEMKQIQDRIEKVDEDQYQESWLQFQMLYPLMGSIAEVPRWRRNRINEKNYWYRSLSSYNDSIGCFLDFRLEDI